MKTIFINFLLLNLLLSCSKDDSKMSDVEVFIQQVKNDKYLADSLPEFTSDAIPVLLDYADDFSEISNFPVNPYSSHGFFKKKVGECLLWTIEYIRLYAGIYASSPGFPSLIPQLMSNEYPYELNNAQLLEVYNLYYSWWYDNKDKDFDTIRTINPLKDSGFRWR